jgi:tRNA dimethylallyltransferase
VKSKAYFLIGPTASGKTDVAHIIARKQSLPILSIDSMQIYEGLDIGTAKPTHSERSGIDYFGLDIVAPSSSFNLAQFYEYAAGAARRIDGEFIVCGGTGLYAKALAENLEDGPEPDPALRDEWEAVCKKDGVAALQSELLSVSPDVYESVRDKENPRRLIRALEWARDGRALPDKWGEGGSTVMTGLEVPNEELAERIAVRATRMFDDGLLDECRQLVEKYGQLSETAAQAIGYREAFAVIEGSMPLALAVEETKMRTRRLAKRQRTWFRHQVNVDWVPTVGKDANTIAEDVIKRWQEQGPAELDL